METLIEEGMLVHILEGADRRRVFWISEESELSILGLGNQLIERLRQFWRSENQVCLSLERIEGVCENSPIRVVAERLAERRRLLVFGAGHVGYSIAAIGAMIGLEVVLIDDREEFLERVAVTEPGIQCILADLSRIDKAVRITRNSVVVIVTRGHQSDEVILRQIADCKAGYVGMIGSRRRVEGVFRRLREQGVSDLFLKQVKAPIGLEIGAKTPQEIAVSVHAEIIRHLSRANS